MTLWDSKAGNLAVRRELRGAADVKVSKRVAFESLRLRDGSKGTRDGLSFEKGNISEKCYSCCDQHDCCYCVIVIVSWMQLRNRLDI